VAQLSLVQRNQRVVAHRPSRIPAIVPWRFRALVTVGWPAAHSRRPLQEVKPNFADRTSRLTRCSLYDQNHTS